MKAGKELDILVAEKVMGYVVRNEVFSDGEPAGQLVYDQEGECVGGPGEGYNPSGSIAQAWQVVEKMGEHPDATLRTLHMVVYPYGRTYATFDGALDSEDWAEANGEGHTPLAICFAALNAVGVA